jgi:CubicO group peptidase (beta-lactamase class C family)
MTVLLPPSSLTAGAGQMQSAGPDLEAIDAYLRSEMESLNIPGLALGVVKGDQIVHLQGFGAADSMGRLVMPQTPFLIGSLTKSFTALAVMQLVDQGRIDLDAPLQRYLPWFQLADPEAAAAITVRHLLNQTSGISTLDGNRFWNSDANAKEAVRKLSAVVPRFLAGKKYQYCNMNYVILGLLVETVSGQSYAGYVSNHILTPLQMRHTYTSYETAVSNGLAEGHYYVFGHAYPREAAVPPAYLATGLLIASAEDITHYLIAQLNDGMYAGQKVLSKQGMDALHTPAAAMGTGNFRYAMGWAAGTMDELSILKHSGDIISFHSSVIFQPEEGWGVVLLANVSGFEQLLQIDELAEAVLKRLNANLSIPITLPATFRILYRGVLLTVLLQVAVMLYTILRRQAVEPWQLILTMLLNLGIAFLFLFKVSGLVPFPLSSLQVYYPELGYGLTTGAALGLLWAITGPILYWIGFFHR